MQLLHQHPKTKRLSSTDKSSMETQLRNAQMEIKLLRQQNKLLANRISQLEKQKQMFQFMEEQLRFRKGQQDSMAILIANYQDINTKLQEQIKTLKQDTHNTPKELATTTDGTSKHNQSFQMDMPVMRNFRASQTKRPSRSDSFEKQKENHPITPKSRVNIDLSNIFQDKLPIKKKVFV